MLPLLAITVTARMPHKLRFQFLPSRCPLAPPPSAMAVPSLLFAGPPALEAGIGEMMLVLEKQKPASLSRPVYPNVPLLCLKPIRKEMMTTGLIPWPTIQNA